MRWNSTSAAREWSAGEAGEQRRGDRLEKEERDECKDAAVEEGPGGALLGGRRQQLHHHGASVEHELRGE